MPEEEKKVEVSPSETESKETVVETTETEQDLLKEELEKVQNKGRSKKDKLLFTKRRIEDQLKELGEDVVEDDEEIEDEDDNKPVTVGMLKKIERQTSVKTALQLADSISNEVERELVKHHIQNTIRSSGNAQEDLSMAQAIVNVVKNRKIIEETQRKPITKTHSSSSGAPAKGEGETIEFTQSEKKLMGKPFNVTPAQIIAARKASGQEN